MLLPPSRSHPDSRPSSLAVSLFANHPFHETVHERVRTVPFADLEAMRDAWQLDIDAVGGFLTDLLDKDDPRLERLRLLA